MTTAKQVIRELWSRHLDVELAPHDDLFDCGADSVMTLSEQVEAENILQKKVATCKLMENPTIAGWIAAFEDAGGVGKCS